ncbi:MAG: hypothetical protein K5777_01920 [Nitrosopumilus sp.]|nr:hypothetical protein [Nitrosopumilus sp.]
MSNDRTAEQKMRKLLNEEKVILDLELAVKKAKYQKDNESNIDEWNWKK